VDISAGPPVTVIEGFKITGGHTGYSGYNGSGLYLSNAHLTISNCTITRNSVYGEEVTLLYILEMEVVYSAVSRIPL